MKLSVAKIATIACIFAANNVHGQSLIVNALNHYSSHNQEPPKAVVDPYGGSYDEFWNAYDSENFSDSIELARQLHDDADPFGSFILGAHYEYGQGTAVNNELAVKYYRTAAENGLPQAMWALSMMIDQGQGVMRQREESIRWARQAFEEGIEEAELLLDDKSIGTVLFADRQKYFNEFASRVVKYSESAAYLYDEKGNYVYIKECNEENAFCGYNPKLFSIDSDYIITTVKDTGGYLEICNEKFINLNSGIKGKINSECFFESYFEPDLHGTANYEIDTVKKPFMVSIPSFKGRTIETTNWKTNIKDEEFTDNSDYYALNAIYFSDEYAWSRWINAERDYLYSANSVEYNNSWNEFGVKSSKICLSESINTVFDMSGCYDIFRLPEYTEGFDFMKNAKFALKMSDDSLFGSSVPRYGDIYDLQSKFDSQLWDPVVDGAIEGFLYGFTQGLLME